MPTENQQRKPYTLVEPCGACPSASQVWYVVGAWIIRAGFDWGVALSISIAQMRHGTLSKNVGKCSGFYIASLRFQAAAGLQQIASWVRFSCEDAGSNKGMPSKRPEPSIYPLLVDPVYVHWDHLIYSCLRVQGGSLER